jgi:pyridoxamine 5'-phosphate oxidase
VQPGGSGQREVLDGAPTEDPIEWVLASLARARASETFDPTRAALATCSRAGVVSVRFVLVKQIDARGFTFFTSYESAKARDLNDNPRAALALHWASLGEQVRVRGLASPIAAEESDDYFATRPRESQLGAWASQQSAVIADRTALDARFAEVTARFAHTQAVPRPPSWGGLRIAPDEIEVWCDRSGRLHDRFLFTRDGRGWTRTRLQP